jgi:radical SAM superfamily enzyme YgiQ (UPF0313 family)
MQEETLKEFDGFDVACIGEGELVIHELVKLHCGTKNTDEFNRIAGIIYKGYAIP